MWIFLNTKSHDEVNLIIVFFWTFSLGMYILYILYILSEKWNLCWFCSRGGGGGVLAKKLDRGVRPAFQNPHPIYDQNLRFSVPFLWPDQKFDTLFMTW